MAHIISCTCDGCTQRTDAAHAHGWQKAHAANRGGNSAWLCPYHAVNIDSYYAENNRRRGVETKPYTYGIEFECNRPSAELRRHFLAHGFIATHDTTVDCEFKSPIFENRKWHRMLETAENLLNSGHGSVGSNCGTHFHVGHKDAINARAIETISAHYHELFDALSLEMYSDKQACAALFGRELERYSWAEPTHFGGSPFNHENFVNIQHSNTLEWRICKFKSAAQYKAAMAFCYKATACVVDNYLAHAEYGSFGGHIVNNAKMAHKAKVTAQKLVRIYKKAAADALAL